MCIGSTVKKQHIVGLDDTQIVHPGRHHPKVAHHERNRHVFNSRVSNLVRDPDATFDQQYENYAANSDLGAIFDETLEKV